MAGKPTPLNADDRLAAIEKALGAAQREAAAAKKVAGDAALSAQEALALAKETHDMVKRMHDTLIEPQPGQTAGLLDRMAKATIAFEGGKATGDRIIWAAGVVAGIGTVAAAFFAAMRGER